MDEQTRADATAYLAALVDAEPQSDWGRPNERTMYQLPGDRRRLMALLRSGGELPGEPEVGQHMLASSCEIGGAEPPPPPSHESYHVCRPGTGLFNVGLPGDRMPTAKPASSSQSQSPDPSQSPSPLQSQSQSGAGPWPGYHPIPVGRHCNWTAPVVTNIPDSHSRACTAPLPDGRIFMIGAQIPKGRDPVVLSISKDGLAWGEAWAVRNCVEQSCKPRFGGPPGFQYPVSAATFGRSLTCLYCLLRKLLFADRARCGSWTGHEGRRSSSAIA